MTSQHVEQSPSTHKWRNRIIGVLAVVVALVVAYFILASFIPRWWAQRIAAMSGHGSFSKGIWSGLALGFFCTIVPLFLLLAVVTMWRWRGGRFLAGGSAVLALAVALPNLMTLTIVLGGSNAAHAGERVLDVNAPGFRGASLIGAIVAAALFVLVLFLRIRRRLRTRRGAKHRKAPTYQQPAAAPTAPVPEPPADKPSEQ
ncbi:glucan phosphoethanolaminetransferase (alkaline phosphatase superfamily) [Nocardia sp. GAS34]|uniref:permease n=1 Tax=unclassified Nocardia TaxID=2637762 RepID=UPI003D1F0A30